MFKMKFSAFTLSIMCLLLIASPYISQRLNNVIKLGIEIMLFLLLLKKGKINRRMLIGLLPITLFFISTCYSTFRAFDFGSRFINSIITNGSYLTFYIFIGLVSIKMGSEYVMRVINKNLFFYMFILDLFVVITMGRGLGGQNEAVYLIGNKFMVAYLHMYTQAFINEDGKRRDDIKKFRRMFLFFVYSCAICIISDTTTGIIGCLCVFMLQILCFKKNKIFDLLCHPVSVIVFFLGINGLFLLTDIIMNNSVISTFFLARSHTSTMLSGRIAMYKISMEAISKNIIWGYGINCDIVYKMLSFGNAQNGILKMLLDYGMIGTIAFCITLLYAFKEKGRNRTADEDACIIFIYAMLFCSLVEINLAGTFMLACALLNGTKYSNDCSAQCYKKGNSKNAFKE